MHKWGGLFFYPGGYMSTFAKPWLSIDDQCSLLLDRGLIVNNIDNLRNALTNIGYYRLSGYWKHYMQTPGAHGKEPFISGTYLHDILALYQTDQKLHALLMPKLMNVEVYLRVNFAHLYAEKHSTEDLLNGVDFRQSIPGKRTAWDNARADLERSREAYIEHYAPRIRGNRDYSRLPLWTAVETFSFGTLSRLIDSSHISSIIAGQLSLNAEYFPGQIQALVSLRNRIAHNARTWNISNTSRPGVTPRWKKEARKNGYTLLESSTGLHPIYTSIFVLDKIHNSAGLGSFLYEEIHPLLEENPVFREGICSPTRYGHMHEFLKQHTL